VKGSSNAVVVSNAPTHTHTCKEYNKYPTTSTIHLSKNLVQHSKSKHIPIKYHYLRDRAENKNIKLEYVPAQEHVAYIFTKPLRRYVFEYLRQRLGVIPLPI
jgi:hypothetical protein